MSSSESICEDLSLFLHPLVERLFSYGRAYFIGGYDSSASIRLEKAKIDKGITLLPTGRYRVRIYKENKPFHGGYYTTLDQARIALQELRAQIRTIQITDPRPSQLMDWFLYSRTSPSLFSSGA